MTVLFGIIVYCTVYFVLVYVNGKYMYVYV